MNEIKMQNKRNKSHIDKNNVKLDTNNYHNVKKENKDTFASIKSEKSHSNNLSSTSPSLVKLAKTTTSIDFQDLKKIKDIEIDKIVAKYSDASFVRSPEKNNLGLLTNNSYKREKQVDTDPTINSKNKSKVPALNFKPNTNSQREVNEEFIFDPVTERDCSFINNISVDNSNFVGDDNKDNDVVLCISNLSIDINGKKYSNGHQMTVLHSEEKLFNKSEYDDNKDLSSINAKPNDKKKLIERDSKFGNTTCTRSKIIVFVIIFVFISIAGIILASVIKK